MPTIFPKSHLGQDRVNGFYETPLATVAYLCRPMLASYQPGRRVLDPSAGDGVFLHYLLGQGVRPEDLHGFDIDPDKVEQLGKVFPNVRLFDATNPYPLAYDFVVGNPPYNGDDSHWVRENRARLQTVAKEIGAKNTYSIITYQSILALRPGGIVSLILSDSFLTNIYYLPFRRFLLAHLELQELLLAPRKLFQQSAADVRTCILTGRRCTGRSYEPGPDELGLTARDARPGTTVRLVNRVQSEADYDAPPEVELVEQTAFEKYPDAVMLIGLPASVRRLFLDCPTRLGDVTAGGTGISTGDDKRFLRPARDVQGDPAWVPYFKNGARQPYWYRPDFCLERDYEKHAAANRTFLVRNRDYYFREGITCSSVGVRFSAAYLPKDALFGVNANFFFPDQTSLFYTLGLLNTNLAWYFARMVLVRSNNISANYLRKLPYLEPDAGTKAEVARTVAATVEAMRQDSAHDYSATQQRLNALFNEIYRLDQSTIKVIDDFCVNFYDRL